MRRWFLSYNSQDLVLMQAFEAALRRKDAEAQIFFAPKSLRAGGYWLPELAKEIAEATAFVLLVGEKGLGPWQIAEYYEAIDRRVKEQNFPVVFVLLEGQPAPGLPFLRQLHWIVTPDPASEKNLAKLMDAVAGAGTRPGELWRHTAPYRGLAAMTEADSDYFFGRVRETIEVIRVLEATPDKLPVLLGNSGVGKSSLAQAGVLASLARQSWPEHAISPGPWPQDFHDSRRWCFLTVRPGVAPLKALIEAFLRTWQLDATDPLWAKRQVEWIEALLDGKLTLRDLLDATERRYAELALPKPSTFLLYVDQGEELYVRAEERQRRRFSEILAHSLGDPRLRALMSLRSDFLGALQNDESLYKARHQIDVPPLREAELYEVVSRPAALLTATFETDALAADVARRTAAESAKDAGALPLLSYLLDDMWTQMVARGDGVLRLPAAAMELGGVLAERANAFLANNPKAETMLRRVLTLRLATVREAGEPTRRRALRSEFTDEEWQLISELADHPNRLLITATPEDSETYAEVAHEAIFGRWQKLGEWVAAEREFLVWHSALEADRRGWEQASEESRNDALLMGLSLAQAQSWLIKRAEDLPRADRAFIDLSLQRDVLERQQRESLRRRVLATAIGALVVVTILAVFSFLQWREADRQRLEAVKQEQVAQQERARAERALANVPRNAAAYIGRGFAYLLKEDYDLALDDFSEAIKLDPKNASAYQGRGTVYQKKEDYDGAIADFSKAISIDPNNASLYDSRGECYREKKELDKAIADADEAIALQPRYAAAYYNRGYAYDDKGDYDRAIADYSEAIRLDPKYARAYNNRGYAYSNKRDYDRAVADYSEAIRLDPSFARAYVNRGDTYESEQDYDRAIADFSEAIRLDPKYVTAYNNRGYAYNNKKDYDRAIADYSDAIKLDPEYVTAYNNRGNSYESRKDYDRAIADFSEAIRLDPKYVFAYYNRGRAYDGKKDYDRAIADFSEAIKLDPKYVFAYYSRGSTYDGKKDYDRAIADFSEAIRLDPKYVFAYYNRGRAYDAKKDYDRAITDYGEAIKIDPKYVFAYSNRGYAYINKKDYDRAIEDYSEAIKLDPKYARAYNSRGYAYSNKHDYDHAIADYSESIRLDPNYVFAYANRGQAYSNKQDYDHAIADFSEAIRLDPQYVFAYNNRGYAYSNKLDYHRAIADYSEAIKLDPKYVLAYVNRGQAYSNKQDYDHAIADYSEAVRLNPKYVQAFRFRGSAYANKRDNDRAASDFGQAIRLQPTNAPYSIIWLHIIHMRTGRNDADEFSMNAANINQAVWPGPIVGLFLGAVTSDVVRTAAQSAGRGQICQADFYLGVYELEKGAREEARRLFQSAADRCPRNLMEYQAARLELDRFP